MKKVLPILLGCLFILSCSSSEDKGKLLAKVYEAELYESDISWILKKAPKSDSIEIAENYISDWIDVQILVHEANKEETVDKEDIDRKVQNFKNDLLIMQLEQKLVNEKLDTTVSDEAIKKYYNEHQADFQLNDYLVKVLYLKIPVDAPDLDKIAVQYKLRNETDIEEIEIYAKIYASNYYYDEEHWIYFDDLLKEVPLQDINKDRFIMKRSKTRFEEAGYYYFLNVIDYKLKNSTSPLSFEKKNIKERIINMRVKDLREEIKNEIISKAYDDKAITRY